MSAGTLTDDQRWLLFAIGGWAMRDCLIGTHGVDHLMQSCYSAYGHTAPDGGPAWLTGWETAGGKITAPARGEVRVVVTKAQINSYARTLPPAIVAELTACRSAEIEERTRTKGWCRCPWQDSAPNSHCGPCTRYHPGVEEEQAHLAQCRRIQAWTQAVLRRALRTDVGQLTLFDGI
jgi:hypothetical protein